MGRPSAARPRRGGAAPSTTPRNSPTNISWPGSTPRLKPNSASASSARQAEIGQHAGEAEAVDQAEAERDQPDAARARSDTTLFSAAIATEAAIADSTRRDGRVTTPSAARLSVIEWATVNAVTTLSDARARGAQLDGIASPSARRSTAGSSSASRNRM